MSNFLSNCEHRFYKIRAYCGQLLSWCYISILSGENRSFNFSDSILLQRRNDCEVTSAKARRRLVSWLAKAYARFAKTRRKTTLLFNAIFFISAAQIEAKPPFYVLYGVQLYSFNRSSNTVVIKLSTFLISVFPFPSSSTM